MKLRRYSWARSLWMLAIVSRARLSRSYLSHQLGSLQSSVPRRSLTSRSTLYVPFRAQSTKSMTFSATVTPSEMVIPTADDTKSYRDAPALSPCLDDSSRSSPVTQATTAKLVSDLAACGQRLRAGKLVAFPTETVYGLGCHALDETAVLRVFQAKERPLSDPLIVHVLTTDDAFELWNVAPNSVAGQVLTTLCQAFWPGPLTLVAPAASHVPTCITADTNFVACRSPSHPLARELLHHAQVPLGAPSANKFGHVSPTTASHVWDDLQHEDVWIVPDPTPTLAADGSSTCDSLSSSVVGGCDVGVESTVAKLHLITDGGDNEDCCSSVQLQVLRQGKVSALDLRECLETANLPVVVETIRRATSDHTVNVAPGQTIRHYSPHVLSFLVSSECCSLSACTTLNDRQREILKDAVVIDYGQRLLHWKDAAHAYRDLSPTADSAEAARVIFQTLRWAEQHPVARIFFPDLDTHNRSDDALLLAVKDRLTRAASGVVLSGFEDPRVR